MLRNLAPSLGLAALAVFLPAMAATAQEAAATRPLTSTPAATRESPLVSTDWLE